MISEELLGALQASAPGVGASLVLVGALGARASAAALAVLVQQQGPVEVLLHYCCRDRSLVGMQSDLVGAHAMGIRNVLLTTGNPGARASYADATSVFDVSVGGQLARRCAQVARALEGRSTSGTRLA